MRSSASRRTNPAFIAGAGSAEIVQGERQAPEHWCVDEAAEGCPARNFEALYDGDMSTMHAGDLVLHSIPCLASEIRGSLNPK